MILAIDVDYKDSYASVAGVLFENWCDEIEKYTYTSMVHGVQEYVPGQFYKRELPCVLKLIQEHNLSPDSIVIDGFVYLDGVSKPGLGKYLYDALEGKVEIIGVAKKPFKGIAPECEVYRGNSKKPLYVTSEGIDTEQAIKFIKSMHGKFRIPTLLKKVDKLCRQNQS
ncbi:endonuclease V [bacterium]|nr:endonuclease V [bacterium]